MTKFDRTLGGVAGAVPSRSAHPPSQIPPPLRQDEFRPSRAPKGQRTPPVGVELPDIGVLPIDAPSWMKRARRLVAALESTIHADEPALVEIAAIERAWSAFELGGVSDAQIVKVSHLCERAHSAIRERFKVSADDTYRSCADVLLAGLLREVQRHLELDEVVVIVRKMRAEADAWVAVVEATACLLKWDQRATSQAAHAIRVAIDSRA